MPDLIADYVRALDRRLVGPRRLKRDMLTEARDSLTDATEAHCAAGLDASHAQRRAKRLRQAAATPSQSRPGTG